MSSPCWILATRLGRSPWISAATGYARRTVKTQDRLSYLQHLALFQQLPADVLSRIAADMKLRQYHRGEVMVWQGKPSDTLYLLVEGIAAVNRSLPGQREHKTIAYVMPGSTFGEVGILENNPRSASVAALTDVEVLVLQRERFLSILHEHASVAVELARSLGRALVEANRRQLQDTREMRVILVLKATERAGQTTVGHGLATVLATHTGKPTVYTEYPDPRPLCDVFGLARDVGTHVHPAGYDISLWNGGAPEPGPEGAHLLYDHLAGRYENIVIGLPEPAGEGSLALLEHANQVLLTAAPQPDAASRLSSLQERIRRYIRPDRTGILVVINHTATEWPELSPGTMADFTLPFIKAPAPLARSGSRGAALDEPLAELAETVISRIDRTHQIRVYIPTTVDVDQQSDTSAYVRETLDFLGQKFGGATSVPARGVWQSQEAGLVGEDVYIVHTYASASAMNEHLDQVIAYAKTLKTALRQEAIALEVDRRLVLI